LSASDRDETIYLYFGINPKTRKVETVSQSRGGRLSHWGDEGVLSTHAIMPGRRAETEITIVWGLTNVEFATAKDSGMVDRVRQRSEKIAAQKEIGDKN
jgi:hypothetical protein